MTDIFMSLCFYECSIIGISAGLVQLSQDTSIWGFFLEAREDPPKKYF